MVSRKVMDQPVSLSPSKVLSAVKFQHHFHKRKRKTALLVSVTWNFWKRLPPALEHSKRKKKKMSDIFSSCCKYLELWQKKG